MGTVHQTRREKLKLLVEKHGTVAALNRALGWEDTNARLYQIHNHSIRTDRGTPYEMGDVTARAIEETLKLPVGWMDTPPGYTGAEADPLIIRLLESVRILKEKDRQADLQRLVQISSAFADLA